MSDERLRDDSEKILEKLKGYADKIVTQETWKELNAAADGLEKAVKNSPAERNAIEDKMRGMLREIPMSDEFFLFFVSAMLQIFKKPQYLELLLEGVLVSETVTLQNLDFIWNNAGNFLFKHPQCETDEVRAAMQRVQNHLYRELRKCVTVHPRTREAREETRVIVMTNTFLGEKHAPSHSALERCCMIEERLGAEVYLVISREGAQKSDFYPYYKPGSVNVLPECDGGHLCSYGERTFKLYQNTKPANTPEGLQELIDMVEKINPYYIVYVNTESYVADIINEFCPVAAVSVTFSKLRNFHTAFAMVGRNVTEAERAAYPCEIIEVPFSFELREKDRSYTRGELGIPEHAFVMAVTGLRLDYDVDDAFLACMETLPDGFLLFVGPFSTYEEKLAAYPGLKERSVCTGMVNNVIGILECADLYVNPRRLGGGFSVIEGFHAGIPAVTIDYGDVAAAAGAQFCVKDYEEMAGTIRRYQSDRAFYEEMLAAGKEREAFITDGGALFEKGIRQMLSSEKFY